MLWTLPRDELSDRLGVGDGCLLIVKELRRGMSDHPWPLEFCTTEAGSSFFDTRSSSSYTACLPRCVKRIFCMPCRPLPVSNAWVAWVGFEILRAVPACFAVRSRDNTRKEMHSNGVHHQSLSRLKVNQLTSVHPWNAFSFLSLLFKRAKRQSSQDIANVASINHITAAFA